MKTKFNKWELIKSIWLYWIQNSKRVARFYHRRYNFKTWWIPFMESVTLSPAYLNPFPGCHLRIKSSPLFLPSIFYWDRSCPFVTKMLVNKKSAQSGWPFVVFRPRIQSLYGAIRRIVSVRIIEAQVYFHRLNPFDPVEAIPDIYCFPGKQGILLAGLKRQAFCKGGIAHQNGGK